MVQETERPDEPRQRFDDGRKGGRWRNRARKLAAIAEATRWSVDVETVYQQMVDAVADALCCDEVHLHLITVERDRFVKLAYHSEDCSAIVQRSHLPAKIGRMQRMLKTHEPIVMDCEHPHREDQIPPEAFEHGRKSAISVPLLAGGGVLGMCSLIYKKSLLWTASDLAYLEDIGRVLGVAIERMQMSKKMSELELLDERKRLSSEIHDNVAQLISTLSLNAAAALASYEEGNSEAVRTDLERLEETSNTTMRVLRDEMLSLRIPLERTDGLVAGIAACLSRFEEHWDVATALTTRVEHEPLVVSLQTSLQLTRILNECLSNTLRHASATRIEVTLEEDARCLTMVVKDDGCGFDPTSVPPERLGLRIMRERAVAAGGSLTIVSGESGTSVCVDISRPQRP